MHLDVEKHTSGGEDGETIGWRYLTGDGRSVWCGEISRSAYEDKLTEEQKFGAGESDGGWFIVLYDDRKPIGEQSEIIARVLDEDSGRMLAGIVAAGIKATSPEQVAT